VTDPAPVPAVIRLASPEVVREAAEEIRAGRLVAFPTETVYGLGADATNDHAVARIFEAKDRPRFNPLIIHVRGEDEALELADVDDRALVLVRRFWPGPLTLVLPRRPGCALSLLVSAGLDTVAVRAPSHPIAQSLLARARCPIAAPSANPSGRISATTAGHVAESLDGRVDLILDGGPCPIGIESTVIDLTGPSPLLLRPGGLPMETVQRVIGPVAPAPGGPVRAPGMLRRHYAPRHPLRLDARAVLPGEVLLGFGEGIGDAALNLSPKGDLREAAANLFTMLRELDGLPIHGIAVSPIPDIGIGQAINDRLRRGAAPEEPAWNDDRGPAGPCVLPDDEPFG
jgi:L-threonylcarbamoyladenylate synthase